MMVADRFILICVAAVAMAIVVDSFMLNQQHSCKHQLKLLNIKFNNNFLHRQISNNKIEQRHKLFPLKSSAVSVVSSSVVHSSLDNLIKTVSLTLAKLVNPVLGGGLLAGGLHAITGPDHLAALLPSSIGQPGWFGFRMGAIWGLGHGLSAILIGSIAYLIKGQIGKSFHVLQKLSSFAESAVGLSLLAIGFLGIKESLQASAEEKEAKSGALDGAGSTKVLDSRAVFANGILHGFSWDGAPSLAPTLAMTSWTTTALFLLAYAFGTMITMAVTAGTIGEASMKLGKAAKDPQLPRRLSMGSSFLAIGIGLFWIYQAIFSH